jgi:NodT family efflux transporter outer membrane factor (OMF) lipoprotein
MIGAAGRIATLASAAALAGCIVGPRYATPPEPKSAGGPFVSAESAAAAANAPVPPLWWRLFNDATLDWLVQRALTENNDLKVAAANLAYAQAQVDEAHAGRYPTTDLSFGPGYGRTETQIAAHDPASFGWAGAFVAAYQVDLFGRIRRTVQAARANAEGLAATEDATRVTVAAETAAAYANLCGYGAQVVVARASLDVVQKTYDLTVQQRDAGALSDFDVERQAVLLEQSRAAIAPLEGQRRAALFSLAALTGMTPKEFPSTIGACEKPPLVARPLPVGDGTALLRRRPDLRAAERQLAAATYRIGVAAADLYPTVTIGASVSSAVSTLAGLANNVAYGVGSQSISTPLITWTFPNTLLAGAHVKEARAQASSALASFDSTVLTALKEAETALSTYATEIDHHAALAAASTHADTALRLAQTQYRLGSYSFLDLLQAEATAVAADQDLSASDQTMAADQVAVFQALGGGWEDAPAVAPPPIAGKTPQIR